MYFELNYVWMNLRLGQLGLQAMLSTVNPLPRLSRLLKALTNVNCIASMLYAQSRHGLTRLDRTDHIVNFCAEARDVISCGELRLTS